MNITDAELFKEKLEDVLQAAEEFGSQAEQFDATKKDLNSFLSVISDLNQQLVDVVISCEDFIKATQSLVAGDFTAKINEEIAKTEEIVDRCKSQCEELTEQYHSILSTFVEQEAGIIAQQEQVILSLDTGFAEEKAKLDGLSQELAVLQGKLEEKSNLITDDIHKSAQGIEENLKKIIGNESSSILKVIADAKVSAEENTDKVIRNIETSSNAIEESIKSMQQAIDGSIKATTQDIYILMNEIKTQVDTLSGRTSKLSSNLNEYIVFDKEYKQKQEAMQKKQGIYMAVGYSVLLILVVLKFFI